MIRMMIRGFAGKTLIFAEEVEAKEQEFDAIAEQYIKRMFAAYPRHMVEIEFLDEPDVNRRFFRVGTDPRGMVKPIAINLTGKSRWN